MTLGSPAWPFVWAKIKARRDRDARLHSPRAARKTIIRTALALRAGGAPEKIDDDVEICAFRGSLGSMLAGVDQRSGMPTSTGPRCGFFCAHNVYEGCVNPLRALAATSLGSAHDHVDLRRRGRRRVPADRSRLDATIRHQRQPTPEAAAAPCVIGGPGRDAAVFAMAANLSRAPAIGTLPPA